MLCRSICFDQRSSSVDIFFLSNYSTKKVALPESNYPKRLPILTKLLLNRSFVPKPQAFWKITATRKWFFRKRRSLKKATALKKQMLRKNNCCVKVVKKVCRSSYSENKAVLKKSLNMPEGESSFEKKIKIKSSN